MGSLRDRAVSILKMLLTAAAKVAISVLLRTAVEKLADIKRRAGKMK
ncbi:MAG: hypothetical protein LBB94_01045 [Clostridiales bacterium]|jgi:hypothetical protein|nr:hypothetical protein [Clostridiales bacterium]